MKRKIILGSAILAGSLYAGSLSVSSDQWTLLGAVDDINTTQLTSSGCETIWTYNSSDNNWSLYHNHVGVSDNYGYTQLTNISKSTGFWAFATTGCTVDYGETVIALAKGTIVDPYLQNARMFQDTNDNGKWDDDGKEPLSTLSDINGSFKFTTKLTSGKFVKIKDQGLHEGKIYDLNLSARVSSNGSVDVISPLTTFEEKGLTTLQIAEILNKSASDLGLSDWNITADDINTDPLDGGLLHKEVGDIKSTDLVKIQASLASYGLLKVISTTALNDWNSTILYNSGMANGDDTTNGTINDLVKRNLDLITSNLNMTTLQSIATGITSARTSSSGMLTETNFPNPEIEITINVALSVIDIITNIGTDASNSELINDNKLMAATTALDTFEQSSAYTTMIDNIDAIAKRNMGLKYKDAYNKIDTNILNSGQFDIDILAGINSTAKGFRFDENGTIIEVND